MIGKTFGRLTVIGESERRFGNRVLRCICSCGGEITAQYGNLTSGATKSCGCLRRETVTRKNLRHGRAKTRTYKIWKDIKRRCRSPKSSGWKDYGGRGIVMCARWSGSFGAFLFDMGECPAGWTIDRADVNSGYEPGNCRWLPRSKQTANQRKTIWVDGVCLKHHCAAGGIPYAAALRRYHKTGELPCGRG
jgi:hypothetical protein